MTAGFAKTKWSVKRCSGEGITVELVGHGRSGGYERRYVVDP